MWIEDDKQKHDVSKLIKLYCDLNFSESLKNDCLRYIPKNPEYFDFIFEINDFIHSKNKTIEQISSIEEKISNYPSLSRSQIKKILRRNIPTIDSIKIDIDQLLDTYDKVGLRDGCMIVRMGPFELNGRDFGQFDVSIPILYMLSTTINFVPQAVAITPNYPKCGRQTPHPHVDHSDVCMGDGLRPYINAIGEARLVDAYEIMSIVLSNYCNEEAYLSLEYWDHTRCPECNGFVSEEEHVLCSKCETKLCVNCVSQCCSMAPETCSKCEYTRFSCYWCGRGMCAECLQVCCKQGCSKHYCEVCLNQCDHQE